MDNITQGDLNGDWIHTDDEPSQGALVFSRNTSKLSPSRGRIGIVLRSDGTAHVKGIAQGDGVAAVETQWLLKDGELHLADSVPNFAPRWKILAADGDKLLMQPYSNSD